jgi:hypothetical protein
MARGGWLAALHPDDREQDARDMEALRANRQVVTEVRTFMKSGECAGCASGATGLGPGQGPAGGNLRRRQDITERKKVEAEREALIRELEAKNAELERFAYTVARPQEPADHDPRLPPRSWSRTPWPETWSACAPTSAASETPSTRCSGC